MYYLAIRKNLCLYIKETDNKKDTANIKIAWVTYNKQLTSKYRLLKKLMTFFSEQAYFASWHQCCRYIRQTTKDMQQITESAYNYYVKLLLDVKWVY